MLELRKFSKSYAGKLILQVDDLRIPGGLIWIRGVNGSGKSTILKSIAGIIPFDGDIFYKGASLKKNPVTIRRKITFAEAEPFFPEMLTGKELLDFVGGVRGVASDGIIKLVEYFGVDIFYRQACGGYSSGMLKKIALVIAFLGSPELILLDEPFAFIDQETEEKLAKMIQSLLREGVSLMITSHHDLSYTDLYFDSLYEIIDCKLVLT